MMKSVMVAEPCAKEKTGIVLPPSMVTPLPKMVKEGPIAGRRADKLIVCPAIGEQSIMSPAWACCRAALRLPSAIPPSLVVT